ncbi:MAG: hypothetical protein EXQ55_01295 [Acidobacteria bacterium]|nr:hypothetical protein [Acidobacteriota bacterium]
MTKTINRLALSFALCAAAATLWSAERTWQTGLWREAKVERPKIVFGVAPNNPNTGAPRTSPPAAKEKRTYVIETDAVRLEIRLDATVDTPRIDALIGEPVTFALERNDIYIKDLDGHEHKMKVAKRTPKIKN